MNFMNPRCNIPERVMAGEKVIILVLVFALGTSTQIVAEKVPIVTFERTPCLGNCQTFKLIVFENRRMMLEAGPYATLDQGQYKARLKKKEYRQLIRLFRESNFMEMEDHQASSAPDLPATYLTFRDDGQSKTILDYQSENSSLKKLEDFLQQLVDKAKWTKSD
jgi:hypothetical protein